MPLETVEGNVGRWFTQQAMLPRRGELPLGFPIWRLAACAGQWQPDRERYILLGDKAADRPDDLPQLLLTAALHGGPLPPHVLAHVVRRIRTDLRVDEPRMALLRVALCRRPQPTSPSRKEPTAVLDEDQDHPAYLYGRLFAVLESLQYRAYQGQERPNTTFFHRYFAGAITNPRVAAVQGCQMFPAWLKKLDNAARGSDGGPGSSNGAESARRAASRYRKRVRTLSDLLDRPMGPMGDAESQSWFILGYFHQQAHDIREARAGRAPEVPVEDLPTTDTGEPGEASEEGNEK
jgi:CRISPR-associated protein Csd1